MDALLEQLKDLATADSAGRYRVLDSIRSLQLSLETPLETVLRLSGQVIAMTLQAYSSRGHGLSYAYRSN